MIWTKICGVTTAADAQVVAREGASAIGLNFVPSSKRCVRGEVIVELVAEARNVSAGQIQIIGVFANQERKLVLETAYKYQLDGVQLHGSESVDELQWFQAQGIWAFKAVGIAETKDVAQAELFPGEHLLLDAKVGSELGGTGRTFDWSLVSALTQKRKIVLAGGLSPDNVAQAIQVVQPYGVDTASGVESAPGIKDERLVIEFLRCCSLAVLPADPNLS